MSETFNNNTNLALINGQGFVAHRTVGTYYHGTVRSVAVRVLKNTVMEQFARQHNKRQYPQKEHRDHWAEARGEHGHKPKHLHTLPPSGRNETHGHGSTDRYSRFP